MVSKISNMRLIINEPLDAVSNMAIDFAIFKSYVKGDSKATLRLYGWSNPTLSLGKFQSMKNIDVDGCRVKSVGVVRRPTGGKSVIHLPSELTYSVVGGSRSGLPDGLEKSYFYVCRALVEGLKFMNINAKIRKIKRAVSSKDICYLSASLSDIEVFGKKLIGNAQLREGNNFIQHGSLPLNDCSEYIGWAFKFGSRDELDEEIRLYNFHTTNLHELVMIQIDRDSLITNIINGFKRSWCCEFDAGQLTDKEMELAELFKNKFSR